MGGNALKQLGHALINFVNLIVTVHIVFNIPLSNSVANTNAVHAGLKPAKPLATTNSQYPLEDHGRNKLNHDIHVNNLTTIILFMSFRWTDTTIIITVTSAQIVHRRKHDSSCMPLA